jgi:hypothetical protein
MNDSYYMDAIESECSNVLAGSHALSKYPLKLWILADGVMGRHTGSFSFVFATAFGLGVIATLGIIALR